MKTGRKSETLGQVSKNPHLQDTYLRWGLPSGKHNFLKALTCSCPDEQNDIWISKIGFKHGFSWSRSRKGKQNRGRAHGNGTQLGTVANHSISKFPLPSLTFKHLLFQNTPLLRNTPRAASFPLRQGVVEKVSMWKSFLTPHDPQVKSRLPAPSPAWRRSLSSVPLHLSTLEALLHPRWELLPVPNTPFYFMLGAFAPAARPSWDSFHALSTHTSTLLKTQIKCYLPVKSFLTQQGSHSFPCFVMAPIPDPIVLIREYEKLILTCLPPALWGWRLIFVSSQWTGGTATLINSIIAKKTEERRG